jgi:thiamine biosynthesis lipoprotein
VSPGEGVDRVTARPVVARTEMIMGLPVSIHLRERPGGPAVVAAEAAAAVDRAFDVMRRCDRIFSPYLADSELQAVRAGRTVAPGAAAEFAAVLEIAECARVRTDGWFDIRYSGALDPSGVVKGWAAQRAGDELADIGCDSYLNAGGDIVCRSAGAPWRIGIEHPFQPSGLLTVLGLRDFAVATSGAAHRGAHIIDPHTASAAGGVRQVTVVGPSLTWADIWATALVAAGRPALLDPSQALIGLCCADGYDLMAVTEDDEVFATDGFDSFQVSDLPRPEVGRIGTRR